jgi:hypothetical protein
MEYHQTPVSDASLFFDCYTGEPGEEVVDASVETDDSAIRIIDLKWWPMEGGGYHVWFGSGSVDPVSLLLLAPGEHSLYLSVETQLGLWQDTHQQLLTFQVAVPDIETLAETVKEMQKSGFLSASLARSLKKNLRSAQVAQQKHQRRTVLRALRQFRVQVRAARKKLKPSVAAALAADVDDLQGRL